MRGSRDVVVRTPMEFAAWPAAERSGDRTSSSGFMVPLPRELVAVWAGDELRVLLEQAGAAPDPDARARLRRPVPRPHATGAAASGLAPPGRAPGRAAVDRAGPYADPAAAGSPPTSSRSSLVTFGTIFNQRPELWARTVEAVADLPVDVIATYGRGRPVPDVGPVPANVRFESVRRPRRVAAGCAAVVTHGGYGTVVAALIHGVPLCCIPVTADNPVNVYAVEQAGAGIVVHDRDARRLPVRCHGSGALSAGAVRAALTTLLDDPSYRTRAQEAGSTIQDLRLESPSTSPLDRASSRTSPDVRELQLLGSGVQETLPMPMAARESQAA